MEMDEHHSTVSVGESRSYWSQVLHDAPETPELPFCRSRPVREGGQRHQLVWELDASLVAALTKSGIEHNHALPQVLLACWAALLSRLSGATDFLINFRSSADDLPNEAIPLRVTLSRESTLAALAHELGESIRSVQQYGAIPLDMHLQLPLGTPGFLWGNISSDDQTNTQAPIALSVRQSGTTVYGAFDYSAAQFDAVDVERFRDHWICLLQAIAPVGDGIITRLALLTPEESTRLTHDVNCIDASETSPLCIHQLFALQVEKGPEATALVWEDHHLTYAELDGRANQLAHYLIELGIKPDTLVAIALPRGIDMVVALLAVLKAGGAYVPLDPAYPLDRLAFVLEDCGSSILITDAQQASLMVSITQSKTIVEIDTPFGPWVALPKTTPDSARVGVEPRNLAYVIYTSGSTGTPKGVMVEHANVVRLFRSTNEWFKFSADDVWTLFHSISFDFSVWELWGALLYGGRLVVVPHMVARSQAEFYRLLCEQRVTVLNQTPSAFRQLITAQSRDQRPHCLRYIIFGGEALDVTSLAPWYAANCAEKTQLINMYGITETTVHVTYRRLSPSDTAYQGSSPIGVRIPDLRIYVLDAHLQPVPIGVTGEMYIGGAGVARGYLNRPQLNVERFLPDVFAGPDHQRMYKSGDLGRWTSDYTLEFIGRNDSQVKIRGFRIEIGEIETVLAAHPNVSDCAVAVRPDPLGDSRLVAYVVIKDTAQQNPNLRPYMADSLPDFMVPAVFVFLPTLPLTINGKLDRAALPTPGAQRPDLAQQYVAPYDETEELICTLFSEQLGIDHAGRLDNFFELGGNSLAVMQLLVSIKKATGRDLPASLLFNQPTPAALARELKQLSNNAVSARHRIRNTRRDVDHGAIAVIAMTGRFPGAANIDQLWQVLSDGLDTVTHFSDDQLDPSVSATLRNAPNYIKARGVIDQADQFDAAFFGISPREVEVMDPQYRLFLELCWECLELGGYVPDASTAPVGVFGGSGIGGYAQNHVRAHPDAIQRVGEMAVLLGNEKDYFATRVAHKLNLTGPALSIYTACSTSLVAIAQAVTSLRAGHCEMALAGGVSITCPPRSGYLHQEGTMLSPDGRTRTFSANGQGTVFSDGAAVVLLKRLTDAVADGDQILSVVRGVAINNDGGEKASFTAPSVDGQAAVISAALADAGVDASSISYVEAHGTATPLGDPIELAALTKAYRQHTEEKGYCRIGSIKSNIGHLIAAAGATGLIKTTLSLQHERLPASLHCHTPNPHINFAETPFIVNTELTVWPRSNVPRRAGISSFGFGGTNSHVIVEEAPHRSPPMAGNGPQLLMVSARTPTALAASLERLASHLEQHPQVNLADIGHTLLTGRKHMVERACVVAESTSDAVQKLRADSMNVRPIGKQPSRRPDMLFMFPGQASQYPGMGSVLYQNEPIFRDAFDACLAALDGFLSFDLKARIFSLQPDALTDTATTQPALFCFEYAFARYWMGLGVQPTALIGHSVGEFVAATLAGVFTLADAVRLVARRGQRMQLAPPGAMLAVRLPASELERWLTPEVNLAAENSPRMSVAAGPQQAIDQLRSALEADGVGVRLLVTSHAFHSAMMDPIVDDFEADVRQCVLSPPNLPIYSTVTGKRLTDAQACDPGYWARHLREPVRFSSALAESMQSLSGVLLEVGPRSTLCALARQHTELGKSSPKCVSSLGDDPDTEWGNMRMAAGLLWIEGTPIDLGQLDVRAQKQRVMLPAYPFERTRHWLEAAIIAPVIVSPAVFSLPANVPENSPMPISMPDTKAPDRLPELIAQLRDVFENISGLDLTTAPVNASFVEIGLDSLALTQVAIQLKQTFKCNITFRQLMGNCSSLESLAFHLDAQLPRAPAPLPATANNLGVATAPSAMASLSTALPAADGSSGGLIHLVIQQQIQIMSQQLALLQGVPATVAPIAPQTATETPHAVPTTPVVPPAVDDTEVATSIKYDVKKAFGAIARIYSDGASELSERQLTRLDAFISRYIERTKLSKESTQANRTHLADPRVVSGFRPRWKEMTYQIVVERSQGSKLWDLDGNEYVDVINGFGMSLFGWQAPFVVEAVKRQIDVGYEIGPQHPLAGEVAQLVCEMTGHDRVGLCNTGSEAVMGAMRIARTITGRNLIVLFSGSYHGIFDEVIVRGTKRLRPVPAAPGILPNTTEHVIVLDYGTPESLEIIRSRADEIAAVLIEPVQSRRPDFQPVEFLKKLRDVTQQAGIVFILDEVITGFRCAQGGIQELFDIRADLCTYGKVIGGGFPVGVIAGKREFMDALDGGAWQYGDDSTPTVGVTYFAGTFVRHPLALAAMKASLDHLQKAGPGLQVRLNELTKNMVSAMNVFCRDVGAPIEVRFFSSIWKIFFTEDHPMQELLFAMMRHRGVHILDNFPCFLTTSHSDQDIAHIDNVFREAVAELQESNFLPRRNDAISRDFDAQRPPIAGARLGKDPQGNPAWFIPDAKNPGKYLKLVA